MPDTILYLAAGLAVTETVGITNFTGTSDSDGIRQGGGSPINISPPDMPEIQLPDITLPESSGSDFGEIGDIFNQMSSQLQGFTQIQQQLEETRQAIQNIGQNPQESVDNSVSGFAEGFTSALDALGSNAELAADNSTSESPSNSTPTDTTQMQTENNGFLYNVGNNLGSLPGNLTAGILEGIGTGFEESIDWGEEQGERINQEIWGQSSDPLSNLLKGENAIEEDNSVVNDVVDSIASGNDMSARQKAKEQGKIVNIPALGGEVPKSFAESVAAGNVNMDVFSKSRNEDLPTAEEIDEQDPWSDYDPYSIGA